MYSIHVTLLVSVAFFACCWSHPARFRGRNKTKIYNNYWGWRNWDLNNWLTSLDLENQTDLATQCIERFLEANTNFRSLSRAYYTNTMNDAGLELCYEWLLEARFGQDIVNISDLEKKIKAWAIKQSLKEKRKECCKLKLWQTFFTIRFWNFKEKEWKKTWCSECYEGISSDTPAPDTTTPAAITTAVGPDTFLQSEVDISTTTTPPANTTFLADVDVATTTTAPEVSTTLQNEVAINITIAPEVTTAMENEVAINITTAPEVTTALENEVAINITTAPEVTTALENDVSIVIETTTSGPNTTFVEDESATPTDSPTPALETTSEADLDSSPPFISVAPSTTVATNETAVMD